MRYRKKTIKYTLSIKEAEMNINPFDVLKNAQKIQEQMGDFQAKLETITVTGSAGGGMVEVDLNGRMDVLAVRISPEVMSDREMLQDLVAAAFTDGMDRIKEAVSRETGNLMGGAGLQGLSSLLSGGQ
jgi:DNA-binding YbaB/EbfC family protein